MPFQPDHKQLASQDAATAHALPARFYTHPESLAAEQEVVFARSWQLVGRADQLLEPGDHIVDEIGGVPILVTRDGENRLRGFHNVCRHRAGPLATCAGRGARNFICRYHGWTYGLDGQLKGAPEMKDAADFDPAGIRLPEIKVESWQGLVLAAVGDVPPLAEVLAGLDERMGERKLDELVFAKRVSYDIACNWKVYVDNFLEGYHLPIVHPGLNKLLDYRSYRTELGDWHSLQWSPLERDDTANNFYGQGDALYYFIYPNTMLNILPGRLQTNRVIPTGLDTCRVEFDFYYAKEDTKRAEQDLEFSDEIQQEDIDICEAVQRGLASGSYEAGRLNPKRETGVWHFHELVRRAYREA
ncbi:MAG: SRPBCC family protein [Gammaproteobacteria bacterium]|nr:SRPBCC family protein [Gammaproteobacteria bacterium]